MPTLVLAGHGDASLSEDRAAALAAAMPAATVRRRPGFSHFCHAEQPGDVGADIAGFLDGLTALPATTPLATTLLTTEE
ncbi:hypothetical protein [Streptomyces malaysiensis]|uniref:Alpha/beta hydrolase n=1 Tax=Streptomyces malaysiensis subsp. samsunensis TaxID=459658 RepID=A0A9X2LS36_STRMQ|nr:hypothetical protein [Streptomyces samsunensis]MCQ8828594.1 hypothetical protein [Streptomyces samsunensis]